MAYLKFFHVLELTVCRGDQLIHSLFCQASELVLLGGKAESPGSVTDDLITVPCRAVHVFRTFCYSLQ